MRALLRFFFVVQQESGPDASGRWLLRSARPPPERKGQGQPSGREEHRGTTGEAEETERGVLPTAADEQQQQHDEPRRRHQQPTRSSEKTATIGSGGGPVPPQARAAATGGGGGGEKGAAAAPATGEAGCDDRAVLVMQRAERYARGGNATTRIGSAERSFARWRLDREGSGKDKE